MATDFENLRDKFNREIERRTNEEASAMKKNLMEAERLVVSYQRRCACLAECL